jgi:hypothetical protein
MSDNRPSKKRAHKPSGTGRLPASRDKHGSSRSPTILVHDPHSVSATTSLSEAQASDSGKDVPPAGANLSRSIPTFGPTTSQALADRLQLLEINSTKFSYTRFAIEAGVQFGKLKTEKGIKQRLSRWINHASDEYELLGSENYERLLVRLLREEPLLCEAVGTPATHLLGHPLYHALGAALECSNLDVINFFKTKMAGAYRIYRPSILQTDYSFIGRMDIAYAPETESFRTRERYSMENGHEWDMQGALFPMSQKLFMTVAIDPHDKTIQAKYFSTILNRPTEKGQVISGFAGWVADLQGDRYYTTRLFAERIDNNLAAELSYVPNETLPNFVKNHLSHDLFSNLNKHILHE